LFDPVIEVEISGLGRQGDGLVVVDGEQLAVPGALPGEMVRVERAGKRARLLEVLRPSPDRVVPSCPHFGPCGGCRLQHLSPPAVADFKRALVCEALDRAGVAAVVSPTISAHGRGRRRVTLHAGQNGAGFNRRQSHETHPIDQCPILVPELDSAPAIARAIFKLTGPCDVGLTVADNGLDVGVRTKGHKKGTGIRAGRRSGGPDLVSVGRQFHLARLILDGELVWQSSPPVLGIGRAIVPLPAGGFLQASARAEEVLGELVCHGARRAKRVADLFCGMGTFALRLAEQAQIYACDNSEGAIEALVAGWRSTSGLRPIKTEVRDLFSDPLEVRELQHFDVVVFDPPRAGARAQAACLAGSEVPVVISVSCDPVSFSRDAAALTSGGYQLVNVQPVDQFEHAHHVEIVGIFARGALRD